MNKILLFLRELFSAPVDAATLARRKEIVPAPIASSSASTPQASNNENTIPAVEELIRQLLRNKFRGNEPVGDIMVIASEGSVGHSGTIEFGNDQKKKFDVVEALWSHNPDKGPDLTKLLQRLLDLSLTSEAGPWYHCKIRIHPDWRVKFEYFLESTPFKSVKELETDELGSVPSFVFKKRFNSELIAELSDFDVNRGLSYHVTSQLASGRNVAKPLLELFATSDWEGDVNNGAMDEYFARREESETGMSRNDLYPLVHAGLLRIEAHQAAAMFAESLALYSHFYPEVQTARSALGIPPVLRQDESDIMKRYYEVQHELDTLRANYLRKYDVKSA